MVTGFEEASKLGYIREPHDFHVEGIKGILKYSYFTLKEGYKPQDIQIEYFLRDALSVVNELTYIDLIQIESEHGKGSGSTLLQAFLSQHKDEFIILNAGAVDEDTYENRLDEHLEMLTKFYEKNDFVNINNRIGFCEESIVFGYDNAALREKLFKEQE